MKGSTCTCTALHSMLCQRFQLLPAGKETLTAAVPAVLDVGVVFVLAAALVGEVRAAGGSALAATDAFNSCAEGARSRPACWSCSRVLSDLCRLLR